jgi:hypothetical protein
MSATTDFEREELVEFLAAYISHAEDSAALVAGCLRNWQKSFGIDPKEQYPPLFLLELAAILWISRWQRSEALSSLGSQFPPACELLSALIKRLEDEQVTLYGLFDAQLCPLMSRVISLWHYNCSWYAPHELGADVLITLGDLGALLQSLANFVFDHRHLSTNGEFP